MNNNNNPYKYENAPTNTSNESLYIPSDFNNISVGNQNDFVMTTPPIFDTPYKPLGSNPLKQTNDNNMPITVDKETGEIVSPTTQTVDEANLAALSAIGHQQVEEANKQAYEYAVRTGYVGENGREGNNKPTIVNVETGDLVTPPTITINNDTGRIIYTSEEERLAALSAIGHQQVEEANKQAYEYAVRTGYVGENGREGNNKPITVDNDTGEIVSPTAQTSNDEEKTEEGAPKIYQNSVGAADIGENGRDEEKVPYTVDNDTGERIYPTTTTNNNDSTNPKKKLSLNVDDKTFLDDKLKNIKDVFDSPVANVDDVKNIKEELQNRLVNGYYLTFDPSQLSGETLNSLESLTQELKNKSNILIENMNTAELATYLIENELIPALKDLDTIDKKRGELANKLKPLIDAYKKLLSNKPYPETEEVIEYEKDQDGNNTTKVKSKTTQYTSEFNVWQEAKEQYEKDIDYLENQIPITIGDQTVNGINNLDQLGTKLKNKCYTILGKEQNLEDTVKDFVKT